MNNTRAIMIGLMLLTSCAICAKYMVKASMLEADRDEWRDIALVQGRVMNDLRDTLEVQSDAIETASNHIKEQREQIHAQNDIFHGQVRIIAKLQQQVNPTGDLIIDDDTNAGPALIWFTEPSGEGTD